VKNAPQDISGLRENEIGASEVAYTVFMSIEEEI
jgi:hypothetical protein